MIWTSTNHFIKTEVHMIFLNFNAVSEL